MREIKEVRPGKNSRDFSRWPEEANNAKANRCFVFEKSHDTGQRGADYGEANCRVFHHLCDECAVRPDGRFVRDDADMRLAKSVGDQIVIDETRALNIC